ncbi:hypothetical protein [Acanthopleuribacter pedis]|uniref:NADPH-dependent 7-cyano-7-deazaguanine reductase N-terminal domain-containing protein n=1 Tax=Acanthopleuribacter pedis TaxID=442870 RepID=A0A8J7QKG7_9BACT|nr:hypothetical protein [Acanthopleuribacter pedis]MBO1319868.1 hypothetical protein [Acanthopleuribacter pedis]
MSSSTPSNAREAALSQLKLGKETAADDTELDIVPRGFGRERFQGASLPFSGFDLWNGYEVSYLDLTGKPQVFHVQMVVDAASRGIVESKSLKLFFNSFNQQTFASRRTFADAVGGRLNEALGVTVELTFFAPQERPPTRRLEGKLLDPYPLTQRPTGYDASLIQATTGVGAFAFHSHLLRSNCPVTNQPDWGAVQITGGGTKHPEPASLLTYLVAMREHQDFHEACCETIFMDLYNTLSPDWLAVSCHYTRRGGWDINPARFTHRPNTVNRGLIWRQ